MSFSSALAFRDDVVALFPGQGSIAHGAGAPWRDSPHWSVVAAVSDVSGVDVERLLLEADDDEIIRTDNAQLATFALSLVGFGDLLDLGVRPRYHLGHSLGEFSALVAAGVLTLDDGARVITARGRAMARAAQRSDGSMVAVMGASEGAREALAGIDGLWVANVNGEGQIVTSGTRAALDELLARHRELGWRRATPLAVGGAFHSPLMADAQADLDHALANATYHDSETRVIANVDASTPADARHWQTLLSRQLTSPVEFLDACLALPGHVSTTVELPPGNVLTGLSKRIRTFDAQFAPSSSLELRESSI
ncbi:MAG: ACP S-malonyltransferase [Acidobacteriota bacterium]|nr:ACP S-malonyltransferase [Acidobacteriota bacterium]MDE3221974.1 ACP S-malonyltransferase [Acidobacteriota bacterium]